MIRFHVGSPVMAASWLKEVFNEIPIVHFLMVR